MGMSVAGLIPAAVGIGSSVFGSGDNEQHLNSVPSSMNIPSLSVPNQDAWWQNYQGQLSTMMNSPNYPGQNYPQFQQQVNNLTGDVGGYGAQAMAGAQNAAGMAPGIAGMEMQGANAMQAGGMAGQGYGQKILEMGFDPQNAYYDRQAGRTDQALQARLAQSGVSNTPYGASVYGQGMSDFNIDWQRQALERANQGIQGYGALGQGMGQQFAGAGALGTGAMNTTIAGAAMPYNTNYGQTSNNLGALSTLNNAGIQSQTLPQQTIGDISAMMTHTQAMNQLAGQMQGQGFQQNQQLGQNFGANMALGANSLGQIIQNQGWFGGNGNSTGGTGWDSGVGIGGIGDVGGSGGNPFDLGGLFDLGF
jgi:hypothetical protein